MSAFVSAESTEVQEYADEVRRCLDDLPGADRDELIDDLRQHLVEVAADAGGDALSARLGPPAAYAAELRASAGLPPRGLAKPAPVAEGPVARAVALVRSALRHPAAHASLRFLDELRPGWWVVRAGAVVVFAALVQTSYRSHIPIPRLLGSRLLTLVALAVAVPASVALGRHARAGRHRALSAAVSLAGLYATWFVAASVIFAARDTTYIQVESTPPRPASLTAEDGRPIFNIYPFAADGTPLEGVLLYDQDGVPITNVADATTRGVPLARTYPQSPNGQPLAHSYPHRVLIPAGPRGPVREDQRPPVTMPPMTTTASPPDN